MKNCFKNLSITELDRLYWEAYGNMCRYKDSKHYREYCETGGEIIKEFERRGLFTPGDIANKIEEERRNIL